MVMLSVISQTLGYMLLVISIAVLLYFLSFQFLRSVAVADQDLGKERKAEVSQNTLQFQVEKNNSFKSK